MNISWAEIFLIVSAIFAVINVWPFWTPNTTSYRPYAFAVSWLFFILSVIAGHGGVAK